MTICTLLFFSLHFSVSFFISKVLLLGCFLFLVDGIYVFVAKPLKILFFLLVALALGVTNTTFLAC